MIIFRRVCCVDDVHHRTQPSRLRAKTDSAVCLPAGDAVRKTRRQHMPRRNPHYLILVKILTIAPVLGANTGCTLFTDLDDKRDPQHFVDGIVPSELTIEVGEAAQIRGVRGGGPADPENVLVRSSDPGVATIRYDGRDVDAGGGRSGDFLATVTGVASGETVVEMSTSANVGPGKEPGQMLVRVIPAPRSVRVSPSMAVLEPGGQTRIECFVTLDRDGSIVTNPAITWTTSDPSVALVAPDGTVTAIIDGTADITCRLDTGESAFATVTVQTKKPFDVTIAPSSALMIVGGTATFTCTVMDGSGTTVANPQLMWSTSDAAVVQVAPTGVVAANAIGSATIMCTLPTGESASANVVVTGPQPPNLTEITGGYSLTASRKADTCPVGTLPSSITNPGPIDVLLIPSTPQVQVRIRSTADVTGPYDPATGDYAGNGVANLGSTVLRELVSGRWQKTTNASGVLIRLIAELTYQILDPANQPVCSATYDAVYTRSQ
jgi:hypothetical protein